MRKSPGRRLGQFLEQSRMLSRLRTRVTGQVKSQAHKGPLSRRRATRTLPPSAAGVKGQPLRGVVVRLLDGLFPPCVWHLAKGDSCMRSWDVFNQMGGGFWASAGAIRLKWLYITANHDFGCYLKIIQSWSQRSAPLFFFSLSANDFRPSFGVRKRKRAWRHKQTRTSQLGQLATCPLQYITAVQTYQFQETYWRILILQ